MPASHSKSSTVDERCETCEEQRPGKGPRCSGLTAETQRPNGETRYRRRPLKYTSNARQNHTQQNKPVQAATKTWPKKTPPSMPRPPALNNKKSKFAKRRSTRSRLLRNELTRRPKALKVVRWTFHPPKKRYPRTTINQTRKSHRHVIGVSRVLL